MSIQIFGIRHHGPGSARSLLHALTHYKPDCVLIEGSPEGEGILPLILHQQMHPPVALLLYAVEQPQYAVFAPFAEFSPEWQALHYALKNNLIVRMIDLPVSHRFALDKQRHDKAEEDVIKQDPIIIEQDDKETLVHEGRIAEKEETILSDAHIAMMRDDPLKLLAEAAGFNDSESWWEQMVEYRRDTADLFEGITEAMATLRTELPLPEDSENDLREAYMRQCIRAAVRDGFQKIAVVCGAWHAPALVKLPSAKEDTAKLKGLPKLKVAATWVPWTYERLASESGYSAGLDSPAWYHHVWHHRNRAPVRWVTDAARLLREQEIDASTASVIETVRTAEAIAALRERPAVSLDELYEAARTVLCFGDDKPMQLVRKRLIIGQAMGRVPDETPMVPLARDLTTYQNRLRLSPDVAERVLELDLRKENDLERSVLLHRLLLLNIPWGKAEKQLTKQRKGTFAETWVLKWEPEFTIRLIESSIHGSTVVEAATTIAVITAEKATEVATLTRLLDMVLLADLPKAVQDVMLCLQNRAALTSDISHLMNGLPSLAQIFRYGNVRKTDIAGVQSMIQGLVARIAIGLQGACSSLDDQAAAAMTTMISSTNEAIVLLDIPLYREQWYTALQSLAERSTIHGLIQGCAARILVDSNNYSHDIAAQMMSRAFSPGTTPAQAAAWIEGFLQRSGLILVHDDQLWGILDTWVCGLSTETFQEMLPLLRRTFSTFEAPERRNLGQKVVNSRVQNPHQILGQDVDHRRGARVLPVVAQLLGLQYPPSH